MAEHLTNEEILQIIRNYKDELQKLKLDANVVIGGIGMVENFIDGIETNRKTGHWILTDVEGNRIWGCKCSECGKDPQDYIYGSEDWWLTYGNLPKFCPTCGSINF